MAITFAVWNYVSDDGVTLKIRIEQAAGTAVNGAAPGGNVEFPPRRGKMRHVDLRLISGTGAKRKRVPVCSKTATIWTSTTVAPFAIGSGTYAVAGRVGEKRY